MQPTASYLSKTSQQATSILKEVPHLKDSLNLFLAWTISEQQAKNEEEKTCLLCTYFFFDTINFFETINADVCFNLSDFVSGMKKCENVKSAHTVTLFPIPLIRPV